MIARHGAFNFLLSDGEALYAHALDRLHWLQRQHPFPTAPPGRPRPDAGPVAANGPDDRMVLVATEPLTHNEPWIPFGPGELQVFADGRQRWRSVRQQAEALA